MCSSLVTAFAMILSIATERLLRQALGGNCVSKTRATTNHWFSASQLLIPTNLWTIEAAFGVKFDFLHEQPRLLQRCAALSCSVSKQQPKYQLQSVQEELGGHMFSSRGICHIRWEFHMGCCFQNSIGQSFRNPNWRVTKQQQCGSQIGWH